MELDKTTQQYTRKDELGSTVMDTAENMKKSDSVITKGAGEVIGFIAHNFFGISDDAELNYYNTRHKELNKITGNNEYLNKLPEADKAVAVGYAPEFTADYEFMEQQIRNNNPDITDTQVADAILNNIKDKAVFADIDKAQKMGIPSEQIYKKLKEDRAKYANYRLDEQVSHSGFVRGVVETLGGIYNAEQDIKKLVGLQDSEETKKITLEVNELGKAIEAGTDTDIISSYTAGTLMPTLLATPSINTTAIAKAGATAGATLFKSLMKRLAVYGGFGAGDAYINTRATDSQEEATESAKIGGALGGALAVIPVDKLANHIANEVIAPMSGFVSSTYKGVAKTSKKKMFAYYKDLFGYKDAELDELTKGFLKINKSTGDELADKTLAMVYAQGIKGAEAMRNANTFGIDTLFNTARENRLNIIRDYAESGKTPSQLADRLQGRIQIAKGNYKDFTDKFITTNGDKRYTINSTFSKGAITDLDNLLEDTFYSFRTEASEIKNLLSGDEITSGDLMLIYRNLNSMLSKTSNGTRMHKLGQLKDVVNTHIEQSMGSGDYAKWLQINKDYKNIVGFTKDTKLGKNFSKLLKDSNGFREINDGKFYKLLNTMDLGDKSYVQLAKATGDIGSIKELEKMTVKAFTQGKTLDDLTYKALSKSLANTEFISKEGKGLKEYVDTLNKHFNIDDRLRALTPSPDDAESSHSSNVKLKALSYILSKMSNLITQAGLNPSEQGINALRLKRILEHTETDVKNINDFLNKVPQIKKDELVNDALKRLGIFAGATAINQILDKPREEIKDPTLKDIPKNEEIESKARVEFVDNLAKKGINIPKDKVAKLINYPNIPASKVLGVKYKKDLQDLKHIKELMFLQDIVHPSTITTDGQEILKLQNAKVKRELEKQLGRPLEDLMSYDGLNGYMLVDEGITKGLKDLNIGDEI